MTETSTIKELDIVLWARREERSQIIEERLFVKVGSGEKAIDIQYDRTPFMKSGQTTVGRKVLPTHEKAIESALKYMAKKVGEGFMPFRDKDEIDELIKGFPQTGKEVKAIYDPAILGQQTAFLKAVRNGDFDKVKSVVEDGADITLLHTTRKYDMQSDRFPVIEAAIYGHKEILAYLLGKLENYFYRNDYYFNDCAKEFSHSYLTAIACGNFHDESGKCKIDKLVELLLDCGYDLSKDLCIFTNYRYFKISPELRRKILAGADLANDTGDAAFVASEPFWGKPAAPEIMRELIERGITLKPTPRTQRFLIEEYVTPLALAKKSFADHPDIIDLFIEKGAL